MATVKVQARTRVVTGKSGHAQSVRKAVRKAGHAVWHSVLVYGYTAAISNGYMPPRDDKR